MRHVALEHEIGRAAENLEMVARALDEKSHVREARIVRAHARQIRGRSFRERATRTMRARRLPSGTAVEHLILELADSFA